MNRWLTLLALLVASVASAGLISIKGPALYVSPAITAIQFVTSGASAHDYVEMPTMPVGFLGGANAEGTLQLWLLPDSGETYETGGAARYANSSWWYTGNNWVLDGFNNSVLSDGSLGITVRSEQLCVLWSDGAQADARTGDVHAIWGGPDIVDGQIWLITITWANTSTSSRIMSAYANDTLVGTETSGARVDMYATWWDDWAGFPVNQDGWFIGAEKQAALNLIELPDFPGKTWGWRWYSRAKDSTEVASDASGAAFSSTGLLAYYPMDEGANTTLTDDVGALTMTAVNPDASFWTTVSP